MFDAIEIGIACPRCRSVDLKLVLTPENFHYGKIICSNCGGFMKWAKMPKKEKRYLEQDAEGFDVVVFGKAHKNERLVDIAATKKGREWLRFMVYVFANTGRLPVWVQERCRTALLEALTDQVKAVMDIEVEN